MVINAFLHDMARDSYIAFDAAPFFDRLANVSLPDFLDQLNREGLSGSYSANEVARSLYEWEEVGTHGKPELEAFFNTLTPETIAAHPYQVTLDAGSLSDWLKHQHPALFAQCLRDGMGWLTP